GGETGAPATSTRPNLRPANDGGSEGGVGSGRLSLVGTSEGLVAGVDALDSPPLPADVGDGAATAPHQPAQHRLPPARGEAKVATPALRPHQAGDRKSTRLNSSHVSISYAVFCLKKKTVIRGRHR